MQSLINHLHTTSGLLGVARSVDGRLSEFRRKGVVDLFTLVTTEPDFLRGGQLADVVIGRGAALLAMKGGVAEVHADVLSQHALEILEGTGIRLTYGQLVPQIMNWKRDGMCLVEALTLHITDPDEAIPLIRNFLEERGIIPTSTSPSM